MASPEDLAQSTVPGEGSSLRLLALLLAAFVAGLASAAAVHSSGSDVWVLSAAAAAFGIFFLTGVVSTRGSNHPMVRHAEAGWAVLHTELARSRRHERHFVLLGIPDGVWLPVRVEASEKAATALRIAAEMQQLLRAPDHAWADGSQLLVLLTDCDRAQAQAFLSRARTSMPHLFPVDRVRVVAFPEDGFTLGALLGALGAGASNQATERSLA